MKSEATFTDAGWDFNDVWSICEGTNYPCLLWSIPAADFVCPDGINFIDFAFFASSWQQDDSLRNIAPPNDIIDIEDLSVFCDNWLEGI
jgi:hypothetical protein